MLGELIPVGGGDPIPLMRNTLRVGRREDCDVVLRFANVSGHHCLMTLEEGYWFIKDTGSRNGVKVNGSRLVGESRKRLDPGDVLAIAKHEYEVKYSPADLGAVGTPPADDMDNVMGQSLLERAGLDRRVQQEKSRRHDLTRKDPPRFKRNDPT